MGGALEDNMMTCVMVGSGFAHGVWDRGAGACGDVIGSQVELVQVIGVKALGNSYAEEGRCCGCSP